MAVDSVQKRMAVAHLKRPGRGVYPDSTSGPLARGSMAWNYVLEDAPAPSDHKEGHVRRLKRMGYIKLR